MNRICAYTHSLDGTVFYVGIGTTCRPFQSRARNKSWIALVTKAKHFDVDIVSLHDTVESAQRAEAELIDQLKPRCNRFINRDLLDQYRSEQETAPKPQASGTFEKSARA